MNENYLAYLYEHNNWANQKIIQACASLTDAQLDADPTSATYGSIRKTLVHMASSQKGYLRELTLPLDERRDPIRLTIADVEESMRDSGETLLALVHDPSKMYPTTPLLTPDDYTVEPWVLLLQIINHATEHREQIKSMLTALGITPPNIDGWNYGFATNALVKITT